jgi:hypothetical protein
MSALRPCVVGLAIAVAIGACGVPADRNATVTDDADVPYDLLSPTTTTLLTGEPMGGETTICLEINGLLLSLGRDRDGEPPLDDDLSLISAGPTEGEASLGVRNVLEGGDPVLAVRRSGDLVEVELSDEFVELPANQQLLAVAQITCTLTAQPGTGRVSFLFEERELEVPLQGGELVDRPVTRDDYADLIAN